MGIELENIELAKNWAKCKLLDVGEIVSGGTPSTREPSYWGNEISWITPADLSGYKSMYISKGRKSLTRKGLQNSSAKLIPKGSILFSSRAPIGYIAIAANELSTNQGFKNIVPYSKINSRYIYYFLQAFKHNAEAVASGTTFKEISSSKFSQLPLLLPPSNEQNRIVSKLDELISELEKGTELLQTTLQQLLIFKKSILKNAFEGNLTENWRKNQKKLKTAEQLVAEINALRINEYDKAVKAFKAGKTKIKPKEPTKIIQISTKETEGLTKLPKGWTWVKVSTIGEIETGTTPSKTRPEFYGSKFPFFKPTELDYGYNVREAKEYLSEIGIKKARLLPKNSILITSIGATIGKTGIIRVEGASNQQINAIIPYSLFNPNFIYFQAISPYFQDQIKSNAVATTLPILNKSKFQNLPFAICSLEEQDLIVNIIENKFSNCDILTETINQNVFKAESLKQSLFMKAFSGKLVEQEVKDEPAINLLKNIELERKIKLKEAKEKKSLSNVMNKKNKENLPETSLIDKIKLNFSKRKFTFEDLKKINELNYDDLRDELFNLLDKDNLLEMGFDKRNEIMKFKYSGK